MFTYIDKHMATVRSIKAIVIRYVLKLEGILP